MAGVCAATGLRGAMGGTPGMLLPPLLALELEVALQLSALSALQEERTLMTEAERLSCRIGSVEEAGPSSRVSVRVSVVLEASGAQRDSRTGSRWLDLVTGAGSVAVEAVTCLGLRI